MDIDLDESYRLACLAGGIFDANALKLYKADDAGLGGLQVPEHVVHYNRVYRRLDTGLDRYIIAEQKICEPRSVSNLVDPFIARNRRDPGSEGLEGAYLWRFAWMASNVSCLASSAAAWGSRLA